MAELADLYRAVILEHGRRPRNVGRLAAATHAADGDNPLCGDVVHVEVVVAGEVLAALRFDGESCAIATASASLMTERLAGRTLTETRRLVADMEALCATGTCRADAELGELAAFADVHRFPVRITCAVLAWRTLERALRI